MTTEKQRRAFISYSRINKEFASKLSKGLRDGGYSIWFDLFDIPTGARWDDEVENALRECSIFMVILTPASIASENVKDEIGYAIDHGKRILPVLLENCDVPLRLRRFQYVDFTTKSFEEGFASAKDLLRDLIDEASVPLPAKTPSVATSTDQKPEAETERKPQEEAERLAAQKAEDERLVKARAETERRAKEESIRLAAQKAERGAKAEMQPTETKAKPVSIATVQKKPLSKGLVIGIVAVVVLVIAGIGYGALSNSRSNMFQENLLAHYPLDGTYKDVLSKYPDIITKNAPFSEGGIYCNGLYTNGGNPDNGCVIDTPPISSLNYKNFSIGADFKVGEYPQLINNFPMPIFVGGGGYRWIGPVLYPDGTIGIMHNNGDEYLPCGGKISLNSWHNVLVTYDGNVGKLYLDNKMLCTTSAFSIVTGDDTDKDISTTNFGNGITYKGYTRDLKIYNLAIAP